MPTRSDTSHMGPVSTTPILIAMNAEPQTAASRTSRPRSVAVAGLIAVGEAMGVLPVRA